MRCILSICDILQCIVVKVSRKKYKFRDNIGSWTQTSIVFGLSAAGSLCILFDGR